MFWPPEAAPTGTGGGLRPPGRPIRKWGPLKVAPMGRPRGLPHNKDRGGGAKMLDPAAP